MTAITTIIRIRYGSESMPLPGVPVRTVSVPSASVTGVRRFAIRSGA